MNKYAVSLAKNCGMLSSQHNLAKFICVNCLKLLSSRSIHNQSTAQDHYDTSPANLRFKVRDRFDFGTKPNIKRWYPRHMHLGTIEMRKQLQKVDCVVEIHDARIPFSGRNPLLQNISGPTPYVLLLNKRDLAGIGDRDMKKIEKAYAREGVDHVFLTQFGGSGNHEHKSLTEILPYCVNLGKDSFRYTREGENAYNLMVVGVPNVGKSSFIQAARKYYLGINTGAPVGRSPGHTKNVSFKIKVSDNPSTYILDTPGVLETRIRDLDTQMKLAICHNILQNALEPEHVADYLLFVLNKKREFAYVKHFQISRPTDTILSLLMAIAIKNKKFYTKKVVLNGAYQYQKQPDTEYGATKFLSAYRQGLLGHFTLDDV